MTWSYEHPSTGVRHEVRFLIGDTDVNDQLFSNEELDYLLTEHGSDALNTAIGAAEMLASRFANMPTSQSIGGVSVNYGQRAAEFRSLAATLRSRRSRLSPPTPYAGGVTDADKDTRDTDSFFTVGMDQDPQAAS